MSKIENFKNFKNEVIKIIEEYLKNENNLKIDDIKTLLFNFNKYKDTLKIYEEDLKYLTIDKIDAYSTPVLNEKVSSSKKYISDFEKNEIKKEKLKYNIDNLKRLIKKINLCLDVIKNDKYYEIIEHRYFEKRRVDDILKMMYISKSGYHFYHSKLLKNFKSVFNNI